MADPDLQIREGPGHPDHEIRRWGGGPKIFFQSFVQQFSVTIRGGGGQAQPWIYHWIHNICITSKLDRQRVQMATDFSAKIK